MSRQSWCESDPTAKRYLTQLVTWGYTISEVEAIITHYAMKDTEDGKPTE